MNSFTNIDINLIHAHPDNPRKDLGDLTELAESIKARGILQNLTVVPRSEGNYTVVIGHRRLAAAKLAGLETVPCVISDMGHREQVATMLLENIQRSDLTPIEQAQGFQMMMDLGDTVAGISEKTGFSDNTIRKRLNLAKLDQDKLQESCQRGGTLMDYGKLEQLKDEKEKNKMLQYIGTRDFDWKLKNAIDEQEKPERKKKLLEILDTFATKIKSVSDIKASLTYETGFHSFQVEGDWKKPKDAGKVKYYYVVDTYGISLYKEAEKASKKEPSAMEKAFNKREAELKKLSKRAYEMRYEFIRNFSAGKKYSREIYYFAFQRLMEHGSPDLDKLLKIFNIEDPDIDSAGWSAGQELRRNLIFEKYEGAPERAMLMAAYMRMNDASSNDYFFVRSWKSKIIHDKNRNLNIIYDMLSSLGYEMSEEEQQLREGSHELFDKSEETV